MEHKHSVFDTDTHFVIARDTREIKLESTTSPVIVQHDHNSERFSFELPRYIDGHDMTLCNEVQVHYLNIDSSTKDTAKGVYTVEDIGLLEGDANTAVCSWLISENATQYAGKLNFMIRFACLADDGTVLYRWNTGIYTELTVVSGYDNGEAVTEDFPDILAQWKVELFGIGDTEEQRLLDVSAEQQAAIAAEGQKQIDAISGKGAAVLDSIPDEYESVSALADQNHRNKAGAIVLDAQGDSILLKDASEYPLMGLKVFGKSEQFTTTGKNLLSTEEAVFTTRNGIKYTAKYDQFGNLEYVSATGTATDLSYCVIAKSMNLPVGDYILSGCPAGGGTDLYDVRFNGITGRDFGDGVHFTITEETTQGSITCVVASGVSVTDLRFTPMIRLATVGDATYEPYTGGVASPSPEYPQEINSVENAGVVVYGKNLVSCADIVIEETSDYYHTFATEFTPTVGETYTLSADVNCSVLPFYINIGAGKKNYNSDMSPKIGAVYSENGRISITFVWNLTEDQIAAGYTQLAIRVPRFSSATVFSATVSNIMLENGASATDYEPYKKPQAVTISHALPGIPVSSGGNYTDANGQQWICDEVDLARGVYVQRVKRYVITGTEDWYSSAVQTGNTYRYDVNLSMEPGAGEVNVVSSHFPCVGSNVAGTWCLVNDVHLALRVKWDYPTLAELKEFFAAQYEINNPVTILYALATPVETALTDAEITAFKALCTNKPNTTILNDAGAYMAVEYVADTKTYIDNKIAELMAQ